MVCTPRARFILLTVAVFVAMTALIVGLTLGLQTPPSPNGGSPDWPSAPETDAITTTHTPAATTTGSATEAPPHWPPSIVHSYRFGGVGSDANPCSKIGTEILARQCGSATDAYIAVMLCIGIAAQHSSGIGGGHFATIYDTPRGATDKRMTTILCREWAPIAATEDMFVNNTFAAQEGGLAIGVPGEIAGFYKAWQMFGRVPWADLFAPSIDLCDNGVIVERSLASAIADKEIEIRRDPNLSELYVKPDDTLVAEGDLLVNPKLADTLRKIADDPYTFYNGTLADDIVADIQEYGGIITKADLEQYIAKEKDPAVIILSNGDYTVNAVRPPSSGGIFAFILNILNGYNFQPSSLDFTEDVQTYHRITEAFKFAYAKRSFFGDEDYVNLTEMLANLTSLDYGEYIRSRINESYTQNYKYYEPDFDIVEDSGTSHANIFAPDGSAVAVTATVNLFFGSKCRGSRTGIIFNDEMDDFSTPGSVNSFGVPASPANYIAPGKMPMSSMCPTLITDTQGRVVYSIGAAGGTRITTGSSLVTMNSLWFKMNLLNATDTPRIHHQLMPEQLRYEPHVPLRILSGLEQKGHEKLYYGSIAVANAVHRLCPDSSTSLDQCEMEVACDGRKGGQPDGF